MQSLPSIISKWPQRIVFTERRSISSQIAAQLMPVQCTVYSVDKLTRRQGDWKTKWQDDKMKRWHNRKKLQQIAKRWQMLPKSFLKNWQKLPNVGNNCQMLTNVDKSCPKMPKLAKRYQKLWKVAKGCQMLSKVKVTKSCQKLPNVCKTCQVDMMSLCEACSPFSSK